MNFPPFFLNWMVNFSSMGIFRSGIWSPRVSKLSLDTFLPPPNRFLKTPICSQLDRSLLHRPLIPPFLFGGFEFLLFLGKRPSAENLFQIVLKDNLFFQKTLGKFTKFVPVVLQELDGPLVLFFDHLGNFRVDLLGGLLAIGLGETVFVLA